MSVRWNATLPIYWTLTRISLVLILLMKLEDYNRTWRFLHGKAVCLNMEEKEDLRKDLLRPDRAFKIWDVQ
jgi:hypothetical protein